MKNNSCLLALLFLLSCFVSANDHIAHSLKNDILPPIAEWHGDSEKLIRPTNDSWVTPAERNGLTDTPDYQTTLAFSQRLAESDPRAHLISIGKSAQGRDIWMFVVSKEGTAEPKSLSKNGKPTLLAQAGIHSGEIDGKDAGLMLLRDILHGDKGYLLEKANWLFVPILSVDAHERRSPFNRVNQRGPEQMGWRTNAQNLNLNRDYAKLDIPELQALISVLNVWPVDLYFDIHVTDGEDYQYDITYGFNREWADSPNISRWLQKEFRPTVDNALKAKGHLGGPLVFGIDRNEFSKGIGGWTASPRFSNGYGDVRQLPTILVENHSLKTYKQRVLGTYVFLESSLKLLGNKGNKLIEATHKDKIRRSSTQVLRWKPDQKHPQKINFAGIDYDHKIDPISGIQYIAWNGKKKLYQNLPEYWSRIADIKVKVPKAFLIPPQYQTVIERLRIHGIKMTRILAAKTMEVVQFTAQDYKLSDKTFEGHQQPTATFSEQQIKYHAAKGSVLVSTDQDLGKLAVALLDPRGPDSFFRWGFFNQMFQRTEYMENYALVPLAAKMIRDEKIKNDFETAKQNDKNLANSSQEQLNWFYRHSEFYDKEYLKYPVLQIR